MQGTPRKKGKSDSISKLGLSPSQQNALANGNSNDINQFKEESVEVESKQEAASPSPSIRQQHDSVSPAPSQSTPAPTKASTKKPPHELLTEAEKKANHIASEQKRRQNIRVGFDSLVEIVPTLSDCHRSEAVILQKSVDYIHRLLNQKNELKSRVRELQTHLGDPVDDVDSVSLNCTLSIFFCFFYGLSHGSSWLVLYMKSWKSSTHVSHGVTNKFLCFVYFARQLKARAPSQFSSFVFLY
ncbi:hypothetical protein F5H01DRAFT_271848 [Linnemannia elongata]|nr:hypothetical protein F5H01DRAFT_271848 [Linnemannia elongata]